MQGLLTKEESLWLFDAGYKKDFSGLSGNILARVQTQLSPNEVLPKKTMVVAFFFLLKRDCVGVDLKHVI